MMRVSIFCCGFPHFRFRNRKCSSFIHNARIRRHRPCELSKPVAVLWSGYPAALVGDVYECIGKRRVGTKKQKSDLSHTDSLPHLHDLVYMYPARRRACLVRSLARRCQDGAARQWRRCLHAGSEIGTGMHDIVCIRKQTQTSIRKQSQTRRGKTDHSWHTEEEVLHLSTAAWTLNETTGALEAHQAALESVRVQARAPRDQAASNRPCLPCTSYTGSLCGCAGRCSTLQVMS